MRYLAQQNFFKIANSADLIITRGELLSEELLLDILHHCQERIEELVWEAATQDLTERQNRELEELEAEVEDIRMEVRKPEKQRVREHQERVREAERLEEEYRRDKEWELVEAHEEWEVVAFVDTKFEWER